MIEPLPSEPVPCGVACAGATSVETLNRDCYCIVVDPERLHAELEAHLAAHGISQVLVESHRNLFAQLPVYVDRRHLERAAEVALALEEVVASAVYQSAVMSWPAPMASMDPGSPGGLLGLDFHLTADGPRLIEINTNPGGVLLNAVLGQAVQSCMPGQLVPPTDFDQIEVAIVGVMREEWGRQRGSEPQGLVAIVDESPAQQYLYPEFLLFKDLFRRHGYVAEICGPEALAFRGGRLWLDKRPVEFVYNRLTDFDFAQPGNAHLREAYLQRAAAFSPHPRAHALYADKRNLTLLSDSNFLVASGISRASMDTLLETVPTTRQVTDANRDVLWSQRRHLFFKPAAGFGSRAAYRGDKLTRRVWEEMAGRSYVAQDIVAPSERYLAADASPLKVDLRCYTYRGEVLLHAARLYRGQTTNFRTPGGGFAPVLTSRRSQDKESLSV